VVTGASVPAARSKFQMSVFAPVMMVNAACCPLGDNFMLMNSRALSNAGLARPARSTHMSRWSSLPCQ
jgi:hypothetical protein